MTMQMVSGSCGLGIRVPVSALAGSSLVQISLVNYTSGRDLVLAVL